MGRKVKRPSVVKTIETLHKATITYFLAKEENRYNGKTGNRAVTNKFITMEEELKDAITVLGKAKKALQDERELEETINFAKSFIQKNAKNTTTPLQLTDQLKQSTSTTQSNHQLETPNQHQPQPTPAMTKRQQPSHERKRQSPLQKPERLYGDKKKSWIDKNAICMNENISMSNAANWT